MLLLLTRDVHEKGIFYFFDATFATFYFTGSEAILNPRVYFWLGGAESVFFPIIDRQAPLAYIGAIIKAFIYGL